MLEHFLSLARSLINRVPEEVESDVHRLYGLLEARFRIIEEKLGIVHSTGGILPPTAPSEPSPPLVVSAGAEASSEPPAPAAS